MFTAAKKLTNLVWLVDWNKKQLDGYTKDVLDMGDYVAKFNAFGFDTQIVNGNCIEEVAEAIEKTRNGGDKPYAIVLDTVKGAGIYDVANTIGNHSLGISAEQKEKWNNELLAQIKELEA